MGLFTTMVVVSMVVNCGQSVTGLMSSPRWWNSTGLTLPVEPTWNNGTDRIGKFFPIFTLVRFSNEPCRTNNEDHGVCYTRTQCQSLGGLASGSCASGLGVCCQFYSTCGSIVNQNQTFFRNPDYPNKYRPNSGSDVCQIRIRRQLNSCQLRLDFLKFDLTGPNVAGGTVTTGVGVEAGVCKDDMFTAPGSPDLCGNLDGQHMYLEFGASDTITLNILLSSNVDRDREWNIELQMIQCRSPTRAPAGCLQYFQGISGQVTSFNFNGGQHLANLAYSVCVRLEEGMRSIEWSACKVGDVRLSGPTPVPATPPTFTNPTVCGVPGGISLNSVDYFVIPGGVYYPLPVQTTGTTTYPNVFLPGQSFNDRFCDVYFAYQNSFVRSSLKPFMLSVKTDAQEVPPIGTTTYMDASTGFCFRFQQSPNV